MQTDKFSRFFKNNNSILLRPPPLKLRPYSGIQICVLLLLLLLLLLLPHYLNLISVIACSKMVHNITHTKIKLQVYVIAVSMVKVAQKLYGTATST